MGREQEKTRFLQVTPGNLRNHHLYVSPHFDFFPADCVGPARKRKDAASSEIEIVLDGLNETVTTDIGANAKTGKPRNFFRGRKWVRRFFEHHRIDAGGTPSQQGQRSNVARRDSHGSLRM